MHQLLKRLAWLVTLMLMQSQGAWAGVTTAEQDRVFFYNTVESLSKSKVCISRVPEFEPKFRVMWRKWKMRYEAQYRVGDAFSRAELAMDPVTAFDKLEAATIDATQAFEKLAPDELQKQCDEILDSLSKRIPKKDAPKTDAPKADAPKVKP